MFFQKASFQLLLASGTGSQGNASELPPARLRGMDQLSQSWIIHLFERLQSILEYVKSKFVQVCHVSSNFEFCDVFERLDGYQFHIPIHCRSSSSKYLKQESWPLCWHAPVITLLHSLQAFTSHLQQNPKLSNGTT